MGSMGLRQLGFTGMLVAALLMIGCTSTTRVNFVGPPGSVLSVDGKSYHLPATVDFKRPSGTSGSMKHDAGLAFTSSETSKDVRAKGYLEAFGYSESDIDKNAVPTCNLDHAHLVQISSGSTVIFRGQSASRQPLYDLTLGRQ